MSWKLQERYERWWKGKYLEDGRRIKSVTYCGNAWAGYVILILEDEQGNETVEYVHPRPFKERPAKKDLKVFDHPPKKEKVASNEGEA